jgi:hypothetical protein
MARTRTPTRGRAAVPTPRGAAMSRLVARFALLLLAGLALLSAAGPLDAPFLDARQHVEFDNAWFTTMARNGLRNGDARSQLGVTLNRYDRWGERIGVPGYYTHHPFLMKALFEQYARLAGTGESAPRSFAPPAGSAPPPPRLRSWSAFPCSPPSRRP